MSYTRSKTSQPPSKIHTHTKKQRQGNIHLYSHKGCKGDQSMRNHRKLTERISTTKYKQIPMKVLNIPKQQNIKHCSVAYTNSAMTHLNSRKLESRPHLIDYFTTKHRGKCGGEKGMRGWVEGGSPIPAKCANRK